MSTTRRPQRNVALIIITAVIGVAATAFSAVLIWYVFM